MNPFPYLAMLGMLALTPSHAQKPAPGPLPAQLRIWFAVPPDQPPAQTGEQLPLQNPYEVTWGGTNARASVCNMPYSEGRYRNFPGAPLAVTLQSGTETKTSLGTATLPLKPGGWYTLIVHPTGRKTWSTLLEDKMEKPPPPPGQEAPTPEPAEMLVPIRFVSLVPGVTADFSLTRTKEKISVGTSTEPGQVLFRLSPGIHHLTVQGRYQNKDFQRGLEVEILAWDRPILMLMEDIYGRLRVPIRSLPAPSP